MADRRAALVLWLAPVLPSAAVLLAGLSAGRGAALSGVAALAPGVVLAAPRLVPLGSILTESRARWLAALAVVVGLATVAPILPVVAMAGVVAVVALLTPRLPRHPTWGAGALTVLCAAFTLAVHPKGSLPAQVLAVGIQAGLGLVIALAACADPGPAFGAAGPEDRARRLLAPAVCAGACAAGLADLPGAGLASAAVVVGFTLWAADGLAEGTLAGAAAGLAAGAALGPAIPAVGAAAFGGAAAGLFRGRSAWAWPIAGLAGNVLAAILSAQPAWGWTAGAAIGAVAAVIVVSRRPGDHAAANTVLRGPAGGALPRVTASLVDRLRASAEACMTLGRDLAVAPLVPGGGEPSVDVGLHLAELVCPGCPALAACWERKLPKARRMVGELWQAAQIDTVSWRDVGGPETIHCLRPREMAESANRLAALGRQRDEFVRLLAQSRRSVLSPLIGLGRHLADLAEQAAATVEPPAALSPLRDLRTPGAERWTGAAAGGWAFEAVVGSLSRPGRAVNGDTARCRPLRGDRLAIVLSDGMGSGEPAAVISAGAAEHLLACLAAGRSSLDALRQTNDQMVTDGGTERFATLDLALVHLRSGLMEWYKMGAAPGLLLHARAVRELPGGGLPAGILPVPEIRSGRVRLRPGDTVVLVSDGVLERPAGVLVAAGRTARAHWAAEWLGRHGPQSSPMAAARGLLEAARRRVADGDHDDLTVLVCRFQETGADGGNAYATKVVAGVDSAGGT